MYERRSADKAYQSSHVRTLIACWRTVLFLMTEILDFVQPKPTFAVHSVPYIEEYSYLRDRTRRSSTQRVFVEAHECCLRFEMLSLFILLGSLSQSNKHMFRNSVSRQFRRPWNLCLMLIMLSVTSSFPRTSWQRPWATLGWMMGLTRTFARRESFPFTSTSCFFSCPLHQKRCRVISPG